jgi:hypothetical protein
MSVIMYVRYNGRNNSICFAKIDGDIVYVKLGNVLASLSTDLEDYNLSVPYSK